MRGVVSTYAWARALYGQGLRNEESDLPFNSNKYPDTSIPFTRENPRHGHFGKLPAPRKLADMLPHGSLAEQAATNPIPDKQIIITAPGDQDFFPSSRRYTQSTHKVLVPETEPFNDMRLWHAPRHTDVLVAVGRDDVLSRLTLLSRRRGSAHGDVRQHRHVAQEQSELELRAVELFLQGPAAEGDLLVLECFEIALGVHCEWICLWAEGAGIWR